MSALLDVVLVVLLLAYLVAGYRLGFLRSAGGLLGVAVGAVAAVLLSPLVASLVDDGAGRVIATVVVACVLLLLGHAVGAALGSVVSGVVARGPVGVVNRILGAGINLVIAALVVSVVASGVTALGVPFLAQPIAGSVVLRVITGATPAPVTSALAQLRSTVMESGIPQIGRALGGPTTAPTAPGTPTSAALDAASRSVLKVTGTAYACGRDQSGTGFVVADDRVLTNAHVLAGVGSPVVLDRDGSALVGSVVHFDPRLDLAVVAVPGLDEEPLDLGDEPGTGTTGVVQGYPFGGPFTASGARVLTVGETRLPDISGGGTSVRDVVTMAANVQQGNSGGPVLSESGDVIGIVFAKSATTSGVGYALTPDQIASLVGEAPALDSAVSTGGCID